MAELKISPEMLQGPVPGMSLTSEPQQFPWEVPTQITTVEEAVEYYSERLMEDEDVEDALLMALDNGVSIERLAEMLTVSATMNGVHNLDVSFLINPYVREVMKLIAEGATVEVLPNDLKTLWPRYTVTAESPVVSSPN